MKYYKIIGFISILFLGMGINSLIWDLRFMNQLLRREMIILMNSGQNYFFIPLGVIDIIFALLLFGLYYWLKKKRKKEANK